MKIDEEIAEENHDALEILTFLDNLKFSNVVNKSTRSITRVIDESLFPAFDEDFLRSDFVNYSEPHFCIKLNLGTDECPRFSCACHKNNIAVRWAIKNHTTLSRDLAKLSSYAGSVKNSINL